MSGAKGKLLRLRTVRLGLLVLLFGAALLVAAMAFLNLRGAAVMLGHDIVSEIARSFAAEVQTALLDARRSLTEVTDLFVSRGLATAPWKRQAALFVDFVDALDPGSKFIWGDRDGVSVHVGPAAEVGLIHIEHTVAGASPPGEQFDVHPGAAWEALAEPSRPYDPRQRPWYALAAGVTGMSWTEPYRFFSNGRSGLTLVSPVLDAKGALQGVLGLDVPLDTLTTVTQQYIRKLPSGRQATILVLDDRQRLLVGPDSEAPPPSSGDGLILARDSRNPVVRGAAAAGDQESLQFEAGGERYMATSLTFEVTMANAKAQRWRVVVAIPSRSVTQHVWAQGWLTAIVAVLGIVLFGLMEWRLRALRDQVRNTRAVGSYTLESRLAQGGMGEVWRASHQLLARPAAVKLIRPDSRRPDDLPRFQREAQATAALRSPHTVAVYDYGIAEDGQFYYVMELLDGLDLETLVERFGPQPAGRVVSILRQCCASLSEAHAAGLVHRDIKPSNIIICRLGTESDYVKLLDFGIVKSLDAGSTTAGGILGTPAYMPPEQADGIVDGRGDIYSLGCVAWWLLAGGTVFGDGAFVDLLLRHRNEAPQRPSVRLGKPLPVGLEDIVMRCLSKRPEDRPTAVELDALLADCGVPPWSEAEADAWWDAQGK